MSTAEEAERFCDICGAPASSKGGFIVDPERFQLLLESDFAQQFNTRSYTGLTREQATAFIKNLARTSRTPWLLCPACARQAEPFL